MADKTTNYELVKPLSNENYAVDVQNGNMDIIDAVLTPTADSTQVPSGNGPGKLSQWLNWLTNRIKAITGKTNWWDTPSKTLEDLNMHLADYVTFKTKAIYGDSEKGTTTIANIDNIVKSGFYVTQNSITIDGIQDWRLISHTENPLSPGYSFQIASALQTAGKIYSRSQINGVWSAWQAVGAGSDGGAITRDSTSTDLSGTRTIDALAWTGQCLNSNTSTTVGVTICSVKINKLRFGRYALAVRLRSKNNTLATNIIQILAQKNVSGSFTNIASRNIVANEFVDVTNYKSFYLDFEYTGAKATNNELQFVIATLTTTAVFEVAVDSIQIVPLTIGLFDVD